MRIARSRGALGGLLLMLLGLWGALIAFIGPSFSFAYTPDSSWTWTAARGWLEVLPGAAVFGGGLLLLVSANRLVALLGSWLAIAGGAWFVVGPTLADVMNIGSPGSPTAGSKGMRALETLAYFYALGAVILFLASVAFGRLSIRSPRDIRAFERDQALTAPVTTGAVTTAAGPTAGAASTTGPSRYPESDEVVLPPDQPRQPMHEQNRHSLWHFGRRRHETETVDRGTSADSPSNH